MSGRRRGPELGLLLLASQVIQFGVDRIPPVTLATIILNVVAYLYMPYSAHEVCLSTHHVWYQWDLKRLILGALDHGNDIHLYYNMVSFLWKGTSLERRFKSPYFAYILVVFTLLTDLTLVGLNGFLAQVTSNQHYIHECAVGFSGVVFALKVLTTHYNPPGTSRLMGFIPVPSKWVYWAELLLIQVLVPNASFTGHLAGILVGLAFVKGPLKKIMDMFIPPDPSTYRYNRGYSGSGSSGHRTGYGNPSYGNPGGSTQSGTRRRQPSAPFDSNMNSNWSQSYPSGRTGNPEEMREADHNYRPSGGMDPPGWQGGSTQGSRLYPDINTFATGYQDYSAGLSEEEQIRRATEESLWDR